MKGTLWALYWKLYGCVSPKPHSPAPSLLSPPFSGWENLRRLREPREIPQGCTVNWRECGSEPRSSCTPGLRFAHTTGHKANSTVGESMRTNTTENNFIVLWMPPLCWCTTTAVNMFSFIGTEKKTSVRYHAHGSRPCKLQVNDSLSNPHGVAWRLKWNGQSALMYYGGERLCSRCTQRPHFKKHFYL